MLFEQIWFFINVQVDGVDQFSGVSKLAVTQQKPATIWASAGLIMNTDGSEPLVQQV